MRGREERVGELLEHDLLDPPLVLRVEVRVEQADRDRLDSGVAEPSHLGANLVVVELRQLHPRLLAQRADAVDDAAGGIVGSGGDLVDGDPAGLLVDEDQVGEGAPDVDADALHATTFRSAGMIVSRTRSICSNLPFRYAVDTSSTPNRPSSRIFSRQRSAGPAIAKSSTSSPVR